MLSLLSQARHRFVSNARNPVKRKQVAVLMIGKLIGLGIVLMLITTFVPKAVHAAGLAA